ncbi:hypothetical protein EMIT043CA1_100069 [Pseudomonas brassicacearum]
MCCLAHRYREQAQLPQNIPESMWEQGLPAMTEVHPASVVPDTPLSRASSAPTEHPGVHVGARLARDDGGTSSICGA